MGVLDWSFRLNEVPARGLEREWTCPADELADVAALLDVPGCEACDVSFRLRATGEQRYLAEGRCRARLVLTCGVTLEPVPQVIDEAFSVAFWPQEQIGAMGVAFDALEADDPEPIENGRLAIGRVVREILASAIDPFPRGSDAALDVTEAGRDDSPAERAESPFAVLQRLKDKSQD